MMKTEKKNAYFSTIHSTMQENLGFIWPNWSKFSQLKIKHRIYFIST